MQQAAAARGLWRLGDGTEEAWERAREAAGAETESLHGCCSASPQENAASANGGTLVWPCRLRWGLTLTPNLTKLPLRLLLRTFYTFRAIWEPFEHVGVPVAYYREDSGTVEVAVLTMGQPIGRSHVHIVAIDKPGHGDSLSIQIFQKTICRTLKEPFI